MSDIERAMLAARLKEKGWSPANLRSGRSSEKAAAVLNVKPRSVIAGAGTVPERQSGWFVHSVIAEDAPHVTEETPGGSQERSTHGGQNSSAVTDNGKPHTETKPEPAVEPVKAGDSVGNGSDGNGHAEPSPCPQQVQFDESILNACRKLLADGNGLVTIPALCRIVNDE
jgi:hypothetical protein